MHPPRSGETMLVASIPQKPALVVGADLIGSWSLESYTDTVEGAGALLPLGINPTGLLIYTPDGFMSAQLMSLDRSPFDVGDLKSSTQSDYQEKSDGFIGYSGEYQFDEVTATVSHMPRVSSQLTRRRSLDQRVRPANLSGSPLGRHMDARLP
jgi:hypothetical protein